MLAEINVANLICNDWKISIVKFGRYLSTYICKGSLLSILTYLTNTLSQILPLPEKLKKKCRWIVLLQIECTIIPRYSFWKSDAFWAQYSVFGHFCFFVRNHAKTFVKNAKKDQNDLCKWDFHFDGHSRLIESFPITIIKKWKRFGVIVIILKFHFGRN